MQELRTRRPPDLFTPIDVGTLFLRNRIVMAPLTRSRAGPGNVPTQLNALYYAQRASAGLIISEATQIAPEGQGYISTPGIHSAEQIAGWKCVTQAVHVAGGPIVCQLWYVGRISHPSFQPGGKAPVAPSAIKPDGQAFTAKGFEPIPTPRALDTAEIPAIVEQYAQAARNALTAGFDGVEVHGANGYLIDQFLRDQTNQRADGYGGSIENRSRFLMEVVDAVIAAVGAERTGVRISPQNGQNDIGDSDPQTLFNHVAERREKGVPISISSKATPPAPRSRRSIIKSSSAYLVASSSPITASTSFAPTRPSPKDAPTSSRSANPSSPIRTW
jgi:N-ethylmaleimide reductase